MENDDDKTMIPSSLMRSSAAGISSLDRASFNVLPVGTRLGEFEITDLIGEGGFGIVYLAYDHSLERNVALKEYMPSGLASRTRTMQVTVRSQGQEETFKIGLRSFINEAKLLARFDSPSLVKVFRFWEGNGTAYMAMPYYEGVTLKQALKTSKIAPTEEWIKAFLAYLFDAVEIIHAAHCYHRDIAPDNILLLKDGRPLLLDFGAARRVIGDRTQGPTAILKPGFAPIEQYADIPTLKQGAWTDVYGLASVVYYLITGMPPPPAVSRIISDDMVPAREAGKGRYQEVFLAAIDHAMAVKPEHRIQSINQFRTALGIGAEIPSSMPPIRLSPNPPQGESTAFSTTVQPDTAKQRPARRTAESGKIFDTAGNDGMPPTMRLPPMHDSKRKAAWAIAAVLVLGGLIAAVNWGVRKSDNTTATVIAGPTKEVAPYAKKQVPNTVNSPGAATDNSANTSVAGQGAGAGDRAGTTSQQATAPSPNLSREESLWNITSGLNNAPAYEAYLNEYPKGRYASTAKARLDRLQAKPRQEKLPAPASPSQDASSERPPGLPQTAGPVAAPEAQDKRLLPKSDTVSQEDELWRAVQNIDKPLAYESFLNKYPNSRYAPAARSSLARLNSSLPAGQRPGPQLPPLASSGGKPPSSSAPPQVEPVNTPGARVPAPTAPAHPGDGAGKEKNPSPTEDKVANIKPAEPASPPARPRPEPSPKSEPETEPDSPVPSVAAKDRKVFRLANQTMTGDFTSDPITGMVSGNGKIVWDNGDQFEGTLVRGIKEGKGQFIWANGQRYKGDWAKGLPNGKGTIHFPNGNRYVGDMKDGVPNGTGTIYFSNGNRYRGEVKDGLPHGTGVNRFTNGDVYSGGWSQGKSSGQGRYTWANGDYWEGEFRDDKKTENGKTVYAASSAANTSSRGATGQEESRSATRPAAKKDRE
jgi:serine/threonine protein kinase